MKLKNGGFAVDLKGLNGLFESRSTVKLICVLDGRVEKHGEEKEIFEKGRGFAVTSEEIGEMSFDKNLSMVWLELSGIDFKAPSPTFTCENLDLLEKIIKAVFENNSRTEMSDAFSENMAAALLSLITFEENTYAEPTLDYVDMAKRYINENYGRQIKVEEIAENIGVDRKYLRNLFFARMGISTKDYLTAVRVEKAKLLLMERELPISDVAKAVGYADALAFSKLFKKHVGVSPSEFREADKKPIEICAEKPAKAPEKKPVKVKTEKTTVKSPEKKEDIKVYLL